MKKWIAILALCLPVLACTFDESQLRTAEGSVAGADARLAADSLLIADTGSGVVPDAFSVVDRVFAQDTPCTQDAPTGVTAMADNRRVTLAWKAAAGAVSYSILRSTTTGVGYLDVGAVVATVPTAAFVDNDTSLVNGTRYYYVVNASNGVCASPDSVEVSAVPFAPDAGTPVVDAALVVDTRPAVVPDAGPATCPDLAMNSYNTTPCSVSVGTAMCYQASIVDGGVVGPCLRVIPGTGTLRWYVPDCSQCAGLGP